MPQFSLLFHDWLARVRLAREDVPLVLTLGPGLFLLGIAFSIGTVASESVLLGKIGAGSLPRALEIQQLAILLCAFTYLKWGRDARSDRPFAALTLGTILVAGLSAWDAASEDLTSATLLFSVVHAATTFSMVHFHNVRGLILDAIATKNLLPRILSLFMYGKVAGGVLSFALASLDRRMWPVAYAFAALAAGIALWWPHARLARAAAGAPAAAPPAGMGLGAAFTHPLSRWALAATALIVVLERSMELTAATYMSRAAAPAELSRVLAAFTTAGAVIAGLVQALFTGPLVYRVGPARTTALFPALALALAAFAARSHHLAGALALRFGFSLLPPATVDPVYGLLEGGLPVRLARTIRALKSGAVRPLLTVIVAYVAARAGTGESLHVVTAAALGLIVLAIPVPALYAATWVDLLRNRGASRFDLSFRPPELEDALHSEIRDGLLSGDTLSAETALELAEAAGSPRALTAVEETLLERPEPRLQLRMLEVLGRAGWTPPHGFLARLAPLAPEARAELYLAPGSGTGEVLALAEADLAPDRPLVARIAAAARQYAAAPGRADLPAILAQGLAARDPELFEVSLRALARSRPEAPRDSTSPVPLPVPRDALRSADERVRRAAIAAHAAAGEVEPLVAAAGTDRLAGVRAAALDAVSRLNGPRGEELAVELLADPSDRVRHAARRVIRRGGRPAMKLVRAKVVDHAAWWQARLHALALVAEEERGHHLLAAIAREEVRRAAHLHAALEALPARSDSVGLSLARALIEDEIAVGIYIAVRCRVAHLGEAYFDTLMTGLRDRNWRVRAQALEGLASHLPDGLPRGLLELVRSTGYLARLYIGATLAGYPMDGAGWAPDRAWLATSPVVPDPESTAGAVGALEGLLDSIKDPFIPAAILWALRDLTGKPRPFAPLSPSPVLDSTQAWLSDPNHPGGTMPDLARIAFLKSTELFVGFGAEELHLIAQATRLERFEKGEYLFRQGDQADVLYIVMKGSVDVLMTGATACEVVTQLGSRETVGELGLFDGLPRSASVRATEPVEALSITRSDMATVLSQSPLVGMGFLKVLALRLRKSSDRAFQSSSK